MAVSVGYPIGLLYRMEPLKQKGVAFQISEDLQTLYIITNKELTNSGTWSFLGLKGEVPETLLGVTLSEV